MLMLFSAMKWLHAALGLLLFVLVISRMARFPNLGMQTLHLGLGVLLISRKLPLFISSLVLFWISIYAKGVPADPWPVLAAGWSVCSPCSFFAGLVGFCVACWRSTIGKFVLVVGLAVLANVIITLHPLQHPEDILPRFNPNTSTAETPSLRLRLCSDYSAEAAAERKRIGVLCEPLAPLSWEEAEKRAEVTLLAMSDEERYSLMQGIGWIGLPTWLPSPLPAIPKIGYYMGNTPPIPRLGVPPLKLHDAGNGFRNMPEPLGASGSTIMWPCSLAFGATWDTTLVKEVAGAIGREYRGKGANVILGPSVQVQRVARNGRNFEYMSGEDPYLGAKMSEAYVVGVQGEGVMACLKHFGFNEQETNRNFQSSVVDEKTAWELYYPPFEAGVAAGAASVMCSYNRVNGTHSCANEALLRRDLKQKMGFRGFVMTDWWALHHPADSSVVRGLDMEMPGAGGETYLYKGDLRTMEESQAGNFTGYGLGLEKSKLQREIYNDPAYRILSAAYKLHLFDLPSCTPGLDCVEPIFSNQRSLEAEKLAMRCASESVVLLKNEPRTGETKALPLLPSKVKKLALIGEAWVAPSRSTNELGMMGDYYSGGGSGHCYIPPELFTLPIVSMYERANSLGIDISSALTNNITDAMNGIKDADAIVVLAATTAEESRDRASLHLDNGADDLIFELAKQEKPAIVLTQVPGTILLPWKDNVDAIALMFLGGEFTGHAWASIIFGDVSPSAKLPIMLPKNESYTVQPSEEFDIFYNEGLYTSYRSTSASEAATYPFGHGLSYTEFQYATPALQDQDCESLLCVQVLVKNVGGRSGAEVVQGYLEFPPEADEPKLILRGFQKTRVLEPGSSEQISFKFTERDFSVYLNGWRLQSRATLHIGSSSADLRQSIELVLPQ